VLIAGAATGFTELVVLVEGLKVLADFAGLDGLFNEETLQDVEDFVVGIVQLLQSVLFPAISGDTWMDANVRVAIKEGQPVTEVLWNRFNTGAIKYGYLLHNDPVVDGPWWAGSGGWTAQTLDASIEPSQLQTGAAVEADGGLAITLQGEIPMALDWGSVLRAHTDAMIQLVTEFLRAHGGVVTEFGDQLENALGIDVPDPVQIMVDAIQDWHDFWKGNLYDPLDQIFVPEIDFDFLVSVQKSPIDGWRVSINGAHDNFPRFSIALFEPGNETEAGRQLAYERPVDLESSLEGPLALFAPRVPTHPESSTVVPNEWFQDWKE
jgi:hypothetical protein